MNLEGLACMIERQWHFELVGLLLGICECMSGFSLSEDLSAG